MKTITDKQIAKMAKKFAKELKVRGCRPTQDMLYCYLAGAGEMRYVLTGKTHVKSK